MFGRVDFRDDKKKKEKEKENFLKSVWLRGGWGKNDGGVQVFSPQAYQKAK